MKLSKFSEFRDIKVFLGGTCNGSLWRDELISKLEIDYFNPVVDDWNEESKERELKEREECEFLLYVITPLMKGVYSIAEVVDDSNKRPEHTLYCFLEVDTDGEGISIKFDKFQKNSLKEVGNLIVRNGGKMFKGLEEVSEYLNNINIGDIVDNV